MDNLPHSLLLQILSRLNDSADVARCRVASKAFNTVYPGLRSINLRCSMKWYINSNSLTKPFKSVFLDLISKLETVESVCVDLDRPILSFDRENDDFYLTDADFAKDWLPRVSGSLKSVSLSDYSSHRQSHLLQLISAYFADIERTSPALLTPQSHNLVNLKLKCAWLSVANLNPMPMLTSLTLECTELEDEHLNEFSKGFPNLQVLNLVGVRGLRNPKIHLHNLKTCVLAVYVFLPSLTLITPNLMTLRIECFMPASLHVKAPKLSHFHLGLNPVTTISPLLVDFLNSENRVENLTLDSRIEEPRVVRDSKFILEKVFKVFPNVSSLCISSGAWSELEACLNPEGWESLDGSKGLKRICAYLTLFDPPLTFASIACVMDHCSGLSEVSFLIYDGDVGPESQSFMSKCLDRWPGLNWRWGIWGEDLEDTWIVDGTRVIDNLNEYERWFVPVCSSELNRTNKRKRIYKRTEFFVRVGSFENDACLCLDNRA
ncbi:hypothetical protein QVD17_03375 [Tagetes erecta]|uniref:F-box domain-containing protein n=1 Tax=Tagetes erecta TaxID=13708 RepID=A0AAD8P9X9_TARER|nr:hypothetical protein QVD17_03375 [Tagetes erecta]